MNFAERIDLFFLVYRKTIYVENYSIKSSKWEKLLGIKIGNKLHFN